MNIVYFTKGQRGSICLAQILKEGYRVGAVIGVVQEDEIDELAAKNGFPVMFLEQINSPASIQLLKDLEPDLFILCGYNRIIKKGVIEIPKLGTINLHGGKLPDFRGAAPINWQIIQGEATGGCSIIYVDEGIDTGDIITQEIYPIGPEDTHASILEKTLEIFPRLLLKVLEQIQNGTVQAQKQDLQEGNYYNRRYPRDSRIHWEEMTAIQVHNLVRGMHGPFQAAFTYRDQIMIEIDRTQILEDTILGNPGRVLQVRGDDIIIMAADRGLLIKEITVNQEKLEPSRFLKIGDSLGKEINEDGKNE